ncbi:retinol dehydrogenase 8 [Pygocentrus nattereri]|uniref:Retinol dehydrogenase n=1 Tax=Pygocentrus nattereri TaxID=42514 RepID=A0A3B4BQX2_PYGNA|nr:retinol dehydrogenase 8 [Pygocentrus nattereri]
MGRSAESMPSGLLPVSPALGPSASFFLSLLRKSVSRTTGMSQKVVLITGCSSGIGLAIAVLLAKDEKKRFMVYATMRNLAKQEPLVEAAGRTLGQTLEIRPLDVCDEKSIKDCVDGLPDRRVDILISNAGLGLVGPIECQDIEEMKSIMDTNFFGLVRLLKEVLPDMKRRKSGHIVVISSVMGIQGILFNDIYAASKFAVEGFCESLAVQAMRFKLNISLIEPGPVVTEFERKVYEEGMKTDLSKADQVTADIFINVYMKHWSQIFESLGQSPEVIAEHTLKIITMDNPPFRHQTNTLYTPFTTLKYADPTGDLPIDTFYKAVFQHDKVFSASLNFLKLLRWRSRKSFSLDKDKS